MQANILFAYWKPIYQISKNMKLVFLNQLLLQILLQMNIKKTPTSLSLVK